MSETNGKHADGYEPPAANGSVTFWCDDVPYTLPKFAGMLDAERRELESFYTSQQKSPTQAVADADDELREHPNLRKEILDRAYADLKKDGDIKQVSVKSLVEWLDTYEGACYSFWIDVRRAYPNVTRDQARDMFGKLTLAGYLKSREDKQAV